MDNCPPPPGLDEQLKSEFEDLVLKARRGELDDWATNAQGSLALVVLLDQFSRNLYRRSVDAFAADGKSWEMSTNAIAQDFDKDKEMTMYQAFAFYMPLMHQETIIWLIAARSLFEGLERRCTNEEERDWIGQAIGASKGHMEQLQKFGRYPTRNALLSRKHTGADEEFLRGQKQSV